MNYSRALITLKEGKIVQRQHWVEKNQFVFILPGDELQTLLRQKGRTFSNRLHNCGEYWAVDSLFIKTGSGDVGPYTASNCDQLAEDWQVVKETPQSGLPCHDVKIKLHAHGHVEGFVVDGIVEELNEIIHSSLHVTTAFKLITYHNQRHENLSPTDQLLISEIILKKHPITKVIGNVLYNFSFGPQEIGE